MRISEFAEIMGWQWRAFAFISMIEDTSKDRSSAVDTFRWCNTALHRANSEWPLWSPEEQQH